MVSRVSRDLVHRIALRSSGTSKAQNTTICFTVLRQNTTDILHLNGAGFGGGQQPKAGFRGSRAHQAQQADLLSRRWRLPKGPVGACPCRSCTCLLPFRQESCLKETGLGRVIRLDRLQEICNLVHQIQLIPFQCSNIAGRMEHLGMNGLEPT